MAPRSTWVPLPRHPARVGEIIEVLWSDYYGAALFGDEGELAGLPYTGCRLEVVATAESAVQVHNPGRPSGITDQP